ncbi:hypothetical protein ACHAXR_007626 [Thalassiosira sp. AJA248-18]
MHLGSFLGSHFSVSDAISPFSKESKSSALAALLLPEEMPTNMAPAATLEKSFRKFLLLLEVIINDVEDSSQGRVATLLIVGAAGVNASAPFPAKRIDAVRRRLRELILVESRRLCGLLLWKVGAIECSGERKNIMYARSYDTRSMTSEV